MKKCMVCIFTFLICCINLVAQEDVKTKDKPVRFSFASGQLIDNQTSIIPVKNTLEWIIQHRFGPMENGISDVYGIYAPGANIRNGFSYAILDNLLLGYGLTLKNMYSDFNIKYVLLEQTRESTIPIFVTLYANMAIDGRNKSVFGTGYKFSNRFSYFSQLIVGRKVSHWLSVQAHTSFTHFNSVPDDMNHDVIGIGLNGRINISPQSSILVQYDIPLKIQSISEQLEFDAAKPNLGLGYEVSTGSHAFQLYVTSSNSILPQDAYLNNDFDYTKGFSDLMFGFTITRLWSF